MESFKNITESSKWKIAYADPDQIEDVFKSFKTPHKLDNSYSPYVFIVDKELDLGAGMMMRIMGSFMDMIPGM